MLIPGGPGFGAPGCVWLGPSEPDNDLLRASTRLEVEPVGVAWPEPAGDWVGCGDAVPDDELSFFLASLLPSLSLSRVRESCSCC